MDHSYVRDVDSVKETIGDSDHNYIKNTEKPSEKFIMENSENNENGDVDTSIKTINNNSKTLQKDVGANIDKDINQNCDAADTQKTSQNDVEMKELNDSNAMAVDSVKSDKDIVDENMKDNLDKDVDGNNQDIVDKDMEENADENMKEKADENRKDNEDIKDNVDEKNLNKDNVDEDVKDKVDENIKDDADEDVKIIQTSQTTAASDITEETTEASQDTSQFDDSQFDDSQIDSSINDSSIQADVEDEEDDGMDEGLEVLYKDLPKYTAKLDMESLRKPFKEGWKREVVQRNVFQKFSDSGKKKSKPVDIYYFTPEGKKLRSMIQISEYLSKIFSKTLSTDDFCFMRKPIYREPFETVRAAGKSKRPYESTIKRGRPTKGNKMSPKPTIKVNRGRSSLPEPEVVIERDEEDDFNVSPYLDMALEASKKRSLDLSTSCPSLEPPVKKKATARKSTTPRPPSANPPPIFDVSRSEGQLCTINCPGLEGKPPELSCCQCMCLFHPKCVNLTDVISGFKCLRCRSLPSRGVENGVALNALKSSTKQTSYTLVYPTQSPSATGLNSSISTTINSTLRSFLDSKTTNMPALEQLTDVSIPPLPPLRLANPSFPRPLIPVLNMPSSTTIQPPRLTAAPGVVRSVVPTATVISPPKSQLGLSPQTPVIVQKPSKETPVNAQLLTLPAAVTKRLNLSQPLALKINNVHIVVPPNCVINSKDGLKVVLPPNTFGLPLDPSAKLNVTVSNNSSAVEGLKSAYDKPSEKSEEIDMDATNINGTTKTVSVVNDNSSEKQKKLSKCTRREGIDPSVCYMKKLYGGYDCMLLIFKYLSTRDLLKAGRVCKTWHLISMQSSLWRTVRLKDVKIPDWEIASKFIRKAAVERLSLKGLHHYDDRNRTWHMLMANLHNLVALQEIKFGLVPATVLHSVCEKLQSLESFSAEYISDGSSEQMWNKPTKIDIGKFATLNHLKELRLRGLGGLVLPTTSNSGNLSELETLHNLQTLSITTLRSFQDSDFHFLSKLTFLHTLEIGDCLLWNEAYNCLGSLVELKRLRLECGGDFNNTGFAESLAKMTQLEELELVMFILPNNLHEVMGSLTKLQRFVIWPYLLQEADSTSTNKPVCAVNSNALKCISNMAKLHYLEWGVISDSTEDPSKTIIPFSEEDFTNPYINIQELTEKLCVIMPSTEKIRVFRTPPLNHTKHNKESS